VSKYHIIIGGTYYLEPRVRFFDNATFYAYESDLHVDRVDWEVVYKKNSLIPQADKGFIFGVKHWVRKMKKNRMNPGQIADRICTFIDHTFGRKMPIGFLDDLELKSSKSVSSRVFKQLLKKFNCQVILQREYLKKESHDDRIKPFAISSVNRLNDAVHLALKNVDLYFRGDNSSDERKKIIKGVANIADINTQLKVYDGGEKSTDKLPESVFFREMAQSRICLNLMGNGYSCYRYQEIPSVGSILATKKYPLVTPNDYTDMENCIQFDGVPEFEDKLKKVLFSKDKVEDMTNKSKEHFLKHHTTEIRFAEFMEHLSCLK